MTEVSTPTERAKDQKWLELIQILQNEIAELKDEIARLKGQDQSSVWPWRPEK